MKRNEKLVIHGNEFYVIDLDCLEKKEKYKVENKVHEAANISKNLLIKKNPIKNDSK